MLPPPVVVYVASRRLRKFLTTLSDLTLIRRIRLYLSPGCLRASTLILVDALRTRTLRPLQIFEDRSATQPPSSPWGALGDTRAGTLLRDMLSSKKSISSYPVR